MEPIGSNVVPGRSPRATAAARICEPDAVGLRLHRELAKSLYARSARLLLRLGVDTTNGSPWLAESRRTVQRLVDLVFEDDTTLVGLTAIKSLEAAEGRRVRTHSVNVAILSLVLGRRAGLGRAPLVEVGMAALLHDVGLDATTDPEMHSLHGAECLLQLGPVDSVVRPALVALEHHAAAEPGCECDGVTRIVQITDAYDTLTARGGAGATPDRALAFVLHDAGPGIDSTLAKVFAQALGVFPPGTLVRLTSGEIGVVLRANHDSRLLDRPLVHLIRDASGEPYGGVPTVDLAANGAEGYLRSIAGSLTPSTYGIAPAAVLLSAF